MPQTCSEKNAPGVEECGAYLAPWVFFTFGLFTDRLECVSKREIRKFEWIFRQFKEEIRRLSSAKSRIDDAEMTEKTPKLRIKEFLRHTLTTTNGALT